MSNRVIPMSRRRIIFCLVVGLPGWYADNLASASGAPEAVDITAKWVFGTKWDSP